MADLPELSDSAKRKLVLRWSSLLDTHGLTGEHFHWHERERDRLRRVARQAGDMGRRTSGGGGLWRRESAVDRTGIAPSVAVAEGRLNDFSAEYWQLWLSSGDGYEEFACWLDILRRQVSCEIASVWVDGSRSVHRWHERACGPAVEKALASLVHEWTKRARADELKRLERGGKAKRPGEALSGDAPANNRPGRRKAVDAYIEEVFSRTGKRITRTDVWKAARYRTRTEFERWERNDRRATRTAHERFTRILSERPHLK